MVMAEEKSASKKPAVIRIKLEWCKGCEICVAFCPKNVLAMEGGKAKVENPGDCIKCMLCELRCPDFAITVE
jgi:2-oxoglutarate ferredoxin oxidoreductase subunit delta